MEKYFIVFTIPQYNINNYAEIKKIIESHKLPETSFKEGSGSDYQGYEFSTFIIVTPYNQVNDKIIVDILHNNSISDNTSLTGILMWDMYITI